MEQNKSLMIIPLLTPWKKVKPDTSKHKQRTWSYNIPTSVTDSLIPLTSIDHLVLLAEHRKAVVLCMGATKQWKPAKVLCHMTIATILKYIGNENILIRA